MTLEERVAALEKAVMGKKRDENIELDLILPSADIDGLHFDEISKRAVFELKEDGWYHSRDILFFSARNAVDNNSVDILTKYLNTGDFKDAINIALPDDMRITCLSRGADITVALPKEKEGVKKYNGVNWWYWLEKAYSESAAVFCGVGSYGYSNHYNASGVGGCAPAFCVA
jgi:hypothetical protein